MLDAGARPGGREAQVIALIVVVAVLAVGTYLFRLTGVVLAAGSPAGVLQRLLRWRQ